MHPLWYQNVVMREAIQRVRDLHSQGKLGNCVVCGASIDDPLAVAWPCDTIRALDGEQG